MKISLHQLALETTRRCNLHCAHCMRGESQNVDMTRDIVDAFFADGNINYIENLVFSGGEPTLNSDIIIYTIDKIINENLDVRSVTMVTNGQIFVPELIEAFNRFNEYNNKLVREKLENIISICDNEFIKNFIKINLETAIDNHVQIGFSTDQFHAAINLLIEEQYLKYSRGLNFKKSCSLKEEEIIKTGFSTIGEEFEYRIYPIVYYVDNIDTDRENYQVMDSIYITSTGYITNEGDGQYTDMDTINFGHISDLSLHDLLVQHDQERKNYLRKPLH